MLVSHCCLPQVLKVSPLLGILAFSRTKAFSQGSQPVKRETRQLEQLFILIFLIQGSSVSPADPSLRCLRPCPTAPVQPRLCLSQHFHPPPACLAPCLPVPAASSQPPPQNSQPAESLFHPSRYILSETNRFPRTVSALDSAGRPAAGPRALQERRAGPGWRGSREESSF